MRACSKCKEEKADDEFYKSRREGRCKECVREYVRDYKSRNPDRVRASHRKNYIKYHSKHLQQQREYRKSLGPDELARRKHDSYERNKDSILAKQKEYHARDEVRQRKKRYDARYKRAHPEIDREINRRQREELRDVYIKKLLTWHNGLAYSDIPASLVEAKREQIRLIRALKSAADGVYDMKGTE